MRVRLTRGGRQTCTRISKHTNVRKPTDRVMIRYIWNICNNKLLTIAFCELNNINVEYARAHENAPRTNDRACDVYSSQYKTHTNTKRTPNIIHTSLTMQTTTKKQYNQQPSKH